jgi:hypothetical protein
MGAGKLAFPGRLGNEVRFSARGFHRSTFHSQKGPGESDSKADSEAKITGPANPIQMVFEGVGPHSRGALRPRFARKSPPFVKV